jgi:hypothetical protein
MGFSKMQFKRIKNALCVKPFIFYFILFFISYIGLNFWINELGITIPTLLRSHNWIFVIPYIAFNFIIVPFLVALTINLSIMRFRELKIMRSGTGGGSFLGGLGILGGVLGGACPACIAGFLPAFLGIFGIVGFSLNSLPLKGLEIQFLSSLLLFWAIWLLSREPVCKVKIKKN